MIAVEVVDAHGVTAYEAQTEEWYGTDRGVYLRGPVTLIGISKTGPVAETMFIPWRFVGVVIGATFPGASA